MKRKTKLKRRVRIAPVLTARDLRTLARFARVCTFIFGERWQADLSRALKLNERTVRAWMQGRTRITPPVVREVARLLARKLSRTPAIQEIMKRLLDDLPAEA